MKVPPDAEVEIRCDCGSLIGFTVTRGVQRMLTVSTRGELTTTKFGGPKWRDFPVNEGDTFLDVLRDPEIGGWGVSCGRTSRNHSRWIEARDIVAGDDGRRRKVLLGPRPGDPR